MTAEQLHILIKTTWANCDGWFIAIFLGSWVLASFLGCRHLWLGIVILLALQTVLGGLLLVQEHLKWDGFSEHAKTRELVRGLSRDVKQRCDEIDTKCDTIKWRLSWK